jgi:hypothetical protein
MNEQAKQKQAKHNSNIFKLEEGVQDMIERVMTVARLLTTDSTAPGDPSTEQAHTRRKKHKSENL